MPRGRRKKNATGHPSPILAKVKCTCGKVFDHRQQKRRCIDTHPNPAARYRSQRRRSLELSRVRNSNDLDQDVDINTTDIRPQLGESQRTCSEGIGAHSNLLAGSNSFPGSGCKELDDFSESPCVETVDVGPQGTQWTQRYSSSLDGVYSYPGVCTEAEYFPFDSFEDFMLYTWDGGVGARTPSSRRRFDLLLSILTDPRFDSKNIKKLGAAKFREYYDERLPLMDVEECKVQVVKAAKKSTKSPISIVSQPFFSIDELACRVMNDPFWSTVMEFGDDYDPKRVVKQFNQTPLHHNIFKWSRNMMLRRKDLTELCVGDFVVIDGQDWSGFIYRVERFSHDPGVIDRSDECSSSWWPKDIVHVRAFKIIRHEVVQTPEVNCIPVDCIGELVRVCDGSRLTNGYKYFCSRRVDENGIYAPFVLTNPLFQYQAVIDGRPFLFFTLFMDAYLTTSSSVTGIYLQWTTVDSKYENISEGIKTISLCEKGLHLPTLVRQIVKSKLTSGGLDTYFAAEDRIVHLEGALALAVADSVQLCSQCRHGGNNCGHNCPNCTTTKEDRLSTTMPVKAYHITRTRSQTDCIVQSVKVHLEQLRITNYSGGPVPRTVVEDLRREFGVLMETSWFESIDFDEHRQGFRDGEHLFFFGLFRDMLNVLTYEKMHSGDVKTFVARLRTFEPPKGSLPLVMDYSIERKQGKRFGSGVSMTAYRQLAMVALFMLDGLLHATYYKHFCNLYLYHVKCMYIDKSVEDIKRVQQEGLSVLAEGAALLPEVYDKPNGHAMLELVLRGLPLLVRTQFAVTGKFESHHQESKSVLPSRSSLLNAMDLYNKRDTLRMCLRGARWGAQRQFVFGPGLRNIRDAKHPERPHAIVSAVSSLCTRPHIDKSEDYDWNADWTPLSWLRVAKSYQRIAPAPAMWALIQEFVTLQEPLTTLPVSMCQFRYPIKLRHLLPDGSSRLVYVGDTCTGKISEDGTDAFAVIHKIIEVHHDTCRFMVVVPRWYGDEKKGTPKYHTATKTRIVSLFKDVSCTEVISVGWIQNKVMPVHHCSDTCITTWACGRHNKKSCLDLACVDTREYVATRLHDPDNMLYCMADATTGFRSIESRTFGYDNSCT